MAWQGIRSKHIKDLLAQQVRVFTCHALPLAWQGVAFGMASKRFVIFAFLSEAYLLTCSYKSNICKGMYTLPLSWLAKRTCLLRIACLTNF